MEERGRTEEVKYDTTEVLTVVNNLYAFVDISFVTTRLRFRSSDAQTKAIGETYRFRGSRWRVGWMRWEGLKTWRTLRQRCVCDVSDALHFHTSW